MPTDVATQTGADRQALRHGLGVDLVFIVGVGVGWPLAFIGAVFTNLLLQAKAPVPARAALGLLVITGGAMIAVRFGAEFLLAYPPLFLMALVFSIFYIFRFAARGGSMLLVALLLISVLLVPSLLLTSPYLAASASWWMVVNIGLALCAGTIFFALIPPSLEGAARKPAQERASDIEANSLALRMTLVTAPYAVSYFAFGGTTILPLIFVAILAISLSSQNSAAMGRNMLFANIIGGFVAIVAYELIIIAPSFPFMAMLVLTITLLASGLLMGGGRLAAYAGSALNTIMILLGGAMVPFGDDVEAKFADRMLGIGSAVLYIAIAYLVVETFLPAGSREPVTQTAPPGGDSGHERSGYHGDL